MKQANKSKHYAPSCARELLINTFYNICKRLEGNGEYCIDLNECYLPGTCLDPGSKCINQVGSYECVCLDGHDQDEHSLCYDIDECVEGTHPCEGEELSIDYNLH